MIKYLLFILALSVAMPSWAGGPWTQPQGKGYFKLSEWWTIFNQHYTDAGKIDPNTTTGVFNTTIYAEYGLTNRFTAVLNFPFISRNYMNNVVSGTTGDILIPGEAINTLGDTELGFKYALTQPGKLPLSLSLILGLPFGEDAGGEQGNLQTGDGEFNQMLQLDIGAGTSFSNQLSVYTSAYTAFNNRTNGYSDEFRFGIEAGLGFFQQKLWTIFRLQGTESLKNGETAETITSTSLFANNAEHTSITVEAAYYITTKLGVSASFATALRGEIIAARPSYSFGVFLDMNKG